MTCARCSSPFVSAAHVRHSACCSDHRCNQVGPSKPDWLVGSEIVVTDILSDSVVDSTHGQDVVIRLHKSKEPAALPQRRHKAPIESDAAKKSPYVIGILIKADTLSGQDIEEP
jgi:hypothetical protein